MPALHALEKAMLAAPAGGPFWLIPKTLEPGT